MTLSCKERVTGNWLQRTEAVSNLRSPSKLQREEPVCWCSVTPAEEPTPRTPGELYGPLWVSPGAGGSAGDNVAPNLPKETAAGAASQGFELLAEDEQCLRDLLPAGLWGGGSQPQLFLEQLPDGTSSISRSVLQLQVTRSLATR